MITFIISDFFCISNKMRSCRFKLRIYLIYNNTGLQGGSIMKGWMNEENVMITCCSNGTRPVIFKIERIDYEEE